MACPETIIKLVERYAEQGSTYKQSNYNETQVRREYVDPFFKALGWDIDNERGFAEAHKDVIHEDSIKIGGATKAPDYCFRTGGTRRFFCETKKPSVNLKDDPSPAFQLRRYGWSAKLPLSILTDFEEFAVYDCRIRPTKTDKASTGRTLYMTWEDYPERWDEIANLFSPDAIYKGSFDKYADSNRKKKGTAEVDDAFLSEIENWRNELAKNIARRNPQLSQRELNTAVQKTIDRIVFLRICEDRGLETYGRLQSAAKADQIYDALRKLFENADERYNSGLFHFHKEKGRNEPPDSWTLSLKIDNAVLKGIIRNLYFPDSPYEFSVLSADILGQVYEQFLGKVIRLTKSHQAKIEEKPEVKKAGGVYYTPTYIVDYIVQNTVGKVVDGKKSHEVAGKTTKWKESKTLQPLTILDPACGSGSFLIGAYQFLLDWYRDRFVEEGPDSHKDRIYLVRKKDWRLKASERKRILLDHIYGVDIDPQAVEVSKLSLLLKVLEGATPASIQSQVFAKQRALPDLADNIKCGNSLIGPEYYTDKPIDLFAFDDQMRINAFDWKAEFSKIIRGGGFSIAIGNPPYRREFGYKELLAEIAATPWGAKYRVARMDLWYYFVHRSLELLRANGKLSFIVNAYWTASTGAKKLIQEIRDTTQVDEIFAFGKLKVFSNVAGQHMMFRLGKHKSNGPATIKIAKPSTELDAEVFVKGLAPVDVFEKPMSKLFAYGKVDLQQTNEGTFEQFTECAVLADFGELRQGIVANPPTVSKKANRLNDNRWQTGEGVFTLLPAELKKLELSQKEKQLCRPFHDLCDLGRYWIASTPSRHIIYSSQKTWPVVDSFPALRSHLSKFRPIMEDRRETRQGKVGWWHLHWPRDEEIWESPKVVCIRMAERPSFVAVQTPLYVPYTAIAFLPKPGEKTSIEFVCALLNSRLLWKWFNHHAKRRGIGLEIGNDVLSKVPIKGVDFSIKKQTDCHDRISEQSRNMHALTLKLSNVKTSHDRTALERQFTSTDREIDRLVYEFYGLSKEEVQIVEESTAV